MTRKAGQLSVDMEMVFAGDPGVNLPPEATINSDGEEDVPDVLLLDVG